jgi:hypothetical protein
MGLYAKSLSGEIYTESADLIKSVENSPVRDIPAIKSALQDLRQSLKMGDGGMALRQAFLNLKKEFKFRMDSSKSGPTKSTSKIPNPGPSKSDKMRKMGFKI